MATYGDKECIEEPLSILAITYEALEERSKLLMGESPVQDSNDHCKSRGGTRGLLYVVPTTDPPRREKQNRSRKKVRQDEARVVPQQRVGHATQEKIPSRRRSKSNQEGRGPDQRERTNRVSGNHRSEAAKTKGTEEEDLIGGWSRHENRRIERALAKWSGDPVKLDPVIVTW